MRCNIKILLWISTLGMIKPSEIDVMSITEFKYYIIPRSRWGELNTHSGYQSSSKLLKYKTVQTAIGDLQVPVEDPSKINDLTDSEMFSVFNTKQRFDGESDSLLGLELLEEGEFDDAEEVLHLAKDTVEREMGKDHVLYANALADLGWLFYTKKHYLKAITYYTEATELDSKFREQYGVRNYAASANMLAISAIRAGREQVTAISAVLEDVFYALLQASDTERYKILINLANIYQRAGLPIRSIAMLKLVRHILKKNQKMTNDIYLFLGTAYVMAGEHKRAGTLLEVAKKGYEDQGKKNSELYLESLYQLAMLDLMSGEAERAFKQMMHVKDAFEELHGKDSPKSALLMCSMGQALCALEETDKCVMFLEAARALTLKDTSSTTKLLDVRIASHLAKAYQLSGQLEKARDTFTEAANAGTHLLGKDNKLVDEFRQFAANLETAKA